MNISGLRILKMMLGGTIGGMLTWIVIEPMASASEMNRGHVNVLEDVLLGVIIGSFIGCCLILAEELESRNMVRIGITLLKGAGYGSLCGLAGAVVGQIVFSILVSAIIAATLIAGEHARSLIVVARTLGWMLMGAGAGICPGAVSKSRKRIMQGILGGIIGGGIGGFLFDFLAASGSGSVSRAVGFISMGAAIGLSVSFVEELGKDAWVTVLTGAKEGRSFILSKPQTLIGRSEMADIPLFGDPAIESNHATIHKSENGYGITATPGEYVVVNSQNVGSAPLSNGDMIGIGSQRLRFNSSGRARRSVGVVPQSYATPEQSPYSPPQSYQPQPPIQGAPSIVATRLQVLSGPHSGAAFALNTVGGPMVIGRDPACEIALAQDGMVSRRHAVVLYDGSNWRIEDSGSTNGVFVDNTRVSSQVLRPGSVVLVGQSQIRVI